jgi:hypothetical protein
VLNEFCRVTLRRTLYPGLAELQRDLDVWVQEYNEVRPHQGRWCYRKTPMQSFLDRVPLAKENRLLNDPNSVSVGSNPDYSTCPPRSQPFASTLGLSKRRHAANLPRHKTTRYNATSCLRGQLFFVSSRLRGQLFFVSSCLRGQLSFGASFQECS